MLEEVIFHSARVKGAAARHLSGKKRIVRLGILPSIGPMRLAPLLIRFAVEQPDIELTLVEAPLMVLDELLLSDRLDAMVSAYVACTDKKLRYCPLYREQIVVVVPKGHRFERLARVPLRDLREERLLFRTNCDLGDFLLDGCRQQGFEPRIACRRARESWVQTMIASGFGVAIMPEFSRINVATVARPLVDPDIVRELSLVTVAGRRQQPAVARLISSFRARDGRDETTHDPASPPLITALKRIAPGSALDT
jgi:DNA-binding transcriptional LysR family regulator